MPVHFRKQLFVVDLHRLLLGRHVGDVDRPLFSGVTGDVDAAAVSMAVSVDCVK